MGGSGLTGRQASMLCFIAFKSSW